MVKVVKPNPDSRISLCGEQLNVDEKTGQHYFLIPEHALEGVMHLIKGYRVEKPEDAETSDPEAHEDGEESNGNPES